MRFSHEVATGISRLTSLATTCRPVGTESHSRQNDAETQQMLRQRNIVENAAKTLSSGVATRRAVFPTRALSTEAFMSTSPVLLT